MTEHHQPMPTILEKKTLRKVRVNRNLLTGLLVIPLMFTMFYWGADFLNLIKRDPAEVVHAFPIETLLGLLLVFVYISAITLFSHGIASLTDEMFYDKAFGPSWSRYAVVYLSCFLGCCILAAGLL